MIEHTGAKKSLRGLSKPMARRRTALATIQLELHAILNSPWTYGPVCPFSQDRHVWPYSSSSTDTHGSTPFPWVFDSTYQWHEWLDTVTCFSREKSWVLPEQKTWDGCLSFISVIVRNILTKSNFVEGRFYLTLQVIVRYWASQDRNSSMNLESHFCFAVLYSITSEPGTSC